MVRWIATPLVLGLLAAAAPTAAETWVTLAEGYAYDSQSARYLASVDGVFVSKRWANGDAIVDSDWLLLCGRNQRWRLIDAGTATWSGPFPLVSHDEAYRQRLCEQGKAGGLPAYTGAAPAPLMAAPDAGPSAPG